MSDGPTPDNLRAKIFRDRAHSEDWRSRSSTGQATGLPVYPENGDRVLPYLSSIYAPW
jgi:hypothetical protein